MRDRLIAATRACALAALVTTLHSNMAQADGTPSMRETLERRLEHGVATGELAGLHCVLATHAGETLAEQCFAGEDERWGTPLGVREHRPDSLHDLRSVTKSVVGLLYGIALEAGEVPRVHERLLDQFPEYPDLAEDARRHDIRIRHALSMTMGTDWDESLPYTDARNSEVAMEQADDRYRFILDRPLLHEPGEKWNYNGGATALVAHLVATGTGMPIDRYASKHLFEPLGIESFEWVRGPDGVASAASGLRLGLRDLAKIGQAIVNDGRHDGRQVIPENWLRESFTPRAAATDGLRYGYFWWLAPEGAPPRWVAGFGNGGQRLAINRDEELVVAILAGNYNRPDAWRIPVKVIVDFVNPALENAGTD